MGLTQVPLNRIRTVQQFKAPGLGGGGVREWPRFLISYCVSLLHESMLSGVQLCPALTLWALTVSALSQTNSWAAIHTVGQKVGNELSFDEMSSNIFEWCGDWQTDYTLPSSYGDLDAIATKAPLEWSTIKKNIIRIRFLVKHQIIIWYWRSGGCLFKHWRLWRHGVEGANRQQRMHSQVLALPPLAPKATYAIE